MILCGSGTMEGPGLNRGRAPSREKDYPAAGAWPPGVPFTSPSGLGHV